MDPEWRIYARSASDDKSPIVVLMQILDAWKAAGVTPPNHLKFIFEGDEEALKVVLDARPDIFNHNLETVPSLYSQVRPQADYRRSLQVLKDAKASGVMTKSGIMVGLGETKDEVKEVLRDLLASGCDAVTIGQYLRPTRDNLEVKEYVDPEVFKEYEDYGRSIGLKHVYSGPFVRSSYNAEKLMNG